MATTVWSSDACFSDISYIYDCDTRTISAEEYKKLKDFWDDYHMETAQLNPSVNPMEAL